MTHVGYFIKQKKKELPYNVQASHWSSAKDRFQAMHTSQHLVSAWYWASAGQHSHVLARWWWWSMTMMMTMTMTTMMAMVVVVVGGDGGGGGDDDDQLWSGDLEQLRCLYVQHGNNHHVCSWVGKGEGVAGLVPTWLRSPWQGTQGAETWSRHEVWPRKARQKQYGTKNWLLWDPTIEFLWFWSCSSNWYML